MLARALALGADGVDPETAARTNVAGRVPSQLAKDVLAGIVAEYLASLQALPALLPAVVEGLTAAQDAGIAVWILTEGPADRQRDRARRLGIDHLVLGVSETQKNTDQFARQRRRFLPADLYVVGDQPDRDIAPAQAAGCLGVLIPSRFRPIWMAERSWGEADCVADDFAAGIQWIIADAAARERRSAASA